MMLNFLPNPTMKEEFELLKSNLSNELNTIKCDMDEILNELIRGNIEDYETGFIVDEIQKISYLFELLIIDSNVHISTEQQDAILEVDNVFIKIFGIIDCRNRLRDVKIMLQEELIDNIDRDMYIKAINNISDEKMMKQPIAENFFQLNSMEHPCHNIMKTICNDSIFTYETWHDILKTDSILYMSQYHKHAPD